MPTLPPFLQRDTGSQKSQPPQPQFFQLSKTSDQEKLSAILEKDPYIKIVDTYENQLKELFVLENPWLHLNHDQRDKEFEPYRDTYFGNQESWQMGNWVYLPWRHAVLHLLEDNSYQKVRTARNRNLITAGEQEKYYNSTIGIAGLSVGNSCALAIVLTGGGKHMKLADPDTLEVVNLNRIRSSVTEITEPKVYLTARQIYELDPYADLTLYPGGITEENFKDFFQSLDVIVDEVDNLTIKIRLRQQAKKQRVPLLMATDNGDSGLLDIERYDLDPSLEPFHGRLSPEDQEKILTKKLPLMEVGRIIGEKLVGMEIVEQRMKDSLMQIGKSIPTWPQLGNAAVLNGVAVSAATRNILTGRPLTDSRALLSLSYWLGSDN